MVDRITVSPNPPCAGQSATICYDFSGVSGTTVNLTLEFEPDSIANIDITIDKDVSNCKTVTIPAGALRLTIVDPNGGADWDGNVDPDCDQPLG